MELIKKIIASASGVCFEEKDPQYPVITAEPQKLHETAYKLKYEGGLDYLSALIGMDWGESLGVIYYLSPSTALDKVIILKTAVSDRENPQLYTVCDIWESANLNEREVYGMFGIRFINHPDMRRLHLNDSWAGFPLRKDYNADSKINPLKLESEDMRDVSIRLSLMENEEVREEQNEIFEKEEYVVNIGPQHPATHGVMHFRTSLDGEIIKKLDIHLGYIHRGIEKMCEGFTYPQIPHLTDRMDYLAAHTSRHAYCMCIEKAIQMEIPERVLYIRTIMDELTRVASHLLGWSAMCMDMGALTAFIYGMRDREKIMEIFEESCGSRLIMNYNVIGGLMYDIAPGFQKKIKEFIPYMRKMLKEYHQIFTGNIIAKERMLGIGFLSKEQAVSFAVTGPSGRASGFSCDLRKYRPYGVYDKVQFEEVLRSEGDAFARYMNRLDEIPQSLDILEQLTDNIPEGDYAVKTKGIIRVPEGEFYEMVEAPRGIFSVYINSKGDKNPYRVKFRPPSLSLVSIIDTISRGEKIADLIAIGGSLDYVVPDIDR